MKSVLLSGAAAAALLLTTTPSFAGESAQAVTKTVEKSSTVIVKHEGPDRTGDFREPEIGPEMHANAQIYNWNDDAVFATPDGSSYKYDGEWEGKYVDPQRRVFEGDWSGKVIRQEGVSAPGFPMPPVQNDAPEYDETYDEAYDEEQYDVPYGYENYERCLKSNGLKGAAIGALLGGFLGNRIAGRGNRTGGTLAGAGIGGLLGVAAEKANDKCKNERPRRPRGPGYYPPQYQNWSHGYYYYPQAPVVTVTVQPAVTTTTVTEETYYETVYVAPRRKAVRKWKAKAKAKPRCVCG
ncbi:glycine zipper 2TM domain-containing protein [Sphingorhabdus sp.]|uniref:glycine zipper 2TM domain-containing protein n=1 Tax=Sphingorhabdus sp. TaxID=1902408 RepID=UPI003593314D